MATRYLMAFSWNEENQINHCERILVVLRNIEEKSHDHYCKLYPNQNYLSLIVICFCKLVIFIIDFWRVVYVVI